VALVAPPTYAHHYYPYCYYPHHALGGAGGGGGGGLVGGGGGGGGHHGGHMQQPIYSRCPPGILYYNISIRFNYSAYVRFVGITIIKANRRLWGTSRYVARWAQSNLTSIKPPPQLSLIDLGFRYKPPMVYFKLIVLLRGEV